MVWTSRSSVRIARPTTTTDEDNMGSFSCRRWMSDGPSSQRGCRCRLYPVNGARPQQRGLRRCPRLVRRVSASSIFSDFCTKSSRLGDTCCYLNGVSAKQQILANILAIYTVWHVIATVVILPTVWHVSATVAEIPSVWHVSATVAEVPSIRQRIP